jgi:predicted O-methyltransferase YrrM
MTRLPIRSGIKDDEAEVLRDLARGRRVLEIGSWFGFSTVLMAQVAEMVHAVDWHQGDDITRNVAGYKGETLGAMWANLTKYGVRKKVVMHVGSSDAVLPLFAHRSFDFAFHDSYHSTERVSRDIGLMLPLIKEGSLLAIHDYGRYGVKDAVDALGLPVVSLTRSLIVVQL